MKCFKYLGSLLTDDYFQSTEFYTVIPYFTRLPSNVQPYDLLPLMFLLFDEDRINRKCQLYWPMRVRNRKCYIMRDQIALLVLGHGQMAFKQNICFSSKLYGDLQPEV
jgi:hypothetical protein